MKFRHFLPLLSFIACAAAWAQSDEISSNPLGDVMPTKDQSMGEDLDKRYADTVRKALGDAGLDDNFWAKAEQLVFGDRHPDPLNAAEAKRLFADAVATPYHGLDPNASIYAGGEEGRKMDEALEKALAALEGAAAPTEQQLLDFFKAFAPYLNTAAAAQQKDNHGTIAVAPGQTIAYTAKPYCLQHNVGAPGSKEPVWLAPATSLIPVGAIDIFKALLSYSGSHPNDQGIIQSLLWAIRESNATPYTNLTPEQARVLNAALPNGAKKFLAFMTGANKPKEDEAEKGSDDGSISSMDSSSSDLLTMKEAKRTVAVNNLARAGIVPHGKNPFNPADVASILETLQAPPPTPTTTPARAQQANPRSAPQPIDRTPQPGDAYSSPAKGIAVKAVADGLGAIRLEVRNTTNKTYRFDPTSFVAFSRPIHQPLAITAPDIPEKFKKLPSEDVRAALAKVDEINARLRGRGDPGLNSNNPWKNLLRRRANGLPYFAVDGPKRVTGFGDPANPLLVAGYPVRLLTTCGLEIPATLCAGNDGTMPAGNAARITDFDCHGFTLGDARFWINNDDMERFLNSASAKRPPVITLVNRTNAADGDLVVYRESSHVVHSAILTDASHGIVTMAAGISTYDVNGNFTGNPNDFKTKRSATDDGWASDRPFTIEYWRIR